jgi:hypothetical protein
MREKRKVRKWRNRGRKGNCVFGSRVIRQVPILYFLHLLQTSFEPFASQKDFA